jgi:subtilisin family serine protease
MMTISSLSKFISLIRFVVLLIALPIVFLLCIRSSQADDVVTSPSTAAPTLVQAAEAQSASGNPVVIRGIVRKLPLGLLGNWLIQASLNVTRTVIVLNLGVLEDQDILPGTWVRADATINLLGITVATRIRIDDFEPDQVVVRLASNANTATVASQYNLTLDSTLLASGDIHLYRTNNANQDVQQLVQQMENDPQIIWAELNYIGGTPEGDPYRTWRWGGTDQAGYVNQEAFSQVNLAPALEHYQGEGIIVGVLDTGLDLNHPALAGHWLNGLDVVADDTTPQDEGDGLAWGHGTHVAGVIAHIAPASKILPVRVLNTNGRGNTFTLAYAVEWAVQQGADVINLSLGTSYDSKVLRKAIEQAIAQGVIIVAAAGNQDTNAIQYPAAYAGTIAITAVDSVKQKADFANYGNWIVLAAPGVGITSTVVGPQGSGYASWSGTSMATPFISGAAVLLRQRLPGVSASEIMTLLTGTAGDLDANNPEYIDQLGGMLDIGTAVLEDSAEASAVPGTVESQLLRLYLPLINKHK